MSALRSPFPQPPGAYAELIVRYLEDDLDASGTELLRSHLTGDAGCRALFVHLTLQRCGIVRLLSREQELSDPGPMGLTAAEAELMRQFTDAMALTGAGLQTDAAESGEGIGQVVPGPASEVPRRPVGERRHRILARHWRAAAAILLLAAAGVGIVWSLRRAAPPPRRDLATITANAGARWDGPPPSTAGLNSMQHLNLASGCIELTFPAGARVVVEGPARCMVDSSTAMSLSSGRLAASVPGGGFMVNTPAGVVTDLGTEFALDVKADGSTDVDVFQGRVQLTTLPAGAGAAQRQSTRILAAGEAATISANAIALDPGGAVPQKFVRSLSTALGDLDVVDLVAGGDGAGHRRGVGIDVTNGLAGALRQRGGASGDYRYHTVPTLPVVDGCFVPDGSRGPVRVDSEGHTFGFPATSNGTYNDIWAGGLIPVTSPDIRRMSTVLGGVDYSQPGHGLLAMHTNKGITLDLDKIRRLHPATLLARFACAAGNTWTPAAGDPPRSPPLADLYVLVDGRPRFTRRAFTPNDGPIRIDVQLREEDRFLTLATTDGGDGISSDGIILGDPRILPANP